MLLSLGHHEFLCVLQALHQQDGADSGSGGMEDAGTLANTASPAKTKSQGRAVARIRARLRALGNEIKALTVCVLMLVVGNTAGS